MRKIGGIKSVYAYHYSRTFGKLVDFVMECDTLSDDNQTPS